MNAAEKVGKDLGELVSGSINTTTLMGRVIVQQREGVVLELLTGFKNSK